MLSKSFSIAAIALIASFSMAKAQIFTTGTITGDSSIENNGMFVEAYNFGGSNETINGVAFTGTNNINGTFAGYTMNGPGFDGTGGGIVSSINGGIDTNLSAALQNVEGIGVHNGGGNLFFELTGLKTGQTYYLQMLINANSHDARTQAFLDGLVLSPTVTAGGNGFGVAGNLNTFGYNPAYIEDVFVATSSTETLHAEVGGGAGAQFSGFVLTTTPEPSTWVLMLSGLGLLGFYARRKAVRG